MYFRGAMADYVKAITEYSASDVADGSTPDDRKLIKESIKSITKFHKQLECKL
jgi:hypothetical protein